MKRAEQVGQFLHLICCDTAVHLGNQIVRPVEPQPALITQQPPCQRQIGPIERRGRPADQCQRFRLGHTRLTGAQGMAHAAQAGDITAQMRRLGQQRRRGGIVVGFDRNEQPASQQRRRASVMPLRLVQYRRRCRPVARLRRHAEPGEPQLQPVRQGTACGRIVIGEMAAIAVRPLQRGKHLVAIEPIWPRRQFGLQHVARLLRCAFGDQRQRPVAHSFKICRIKPCRFAKQRGGGVAQLIAGLRVKEGQHRVRRKAHPPLPQQRVGLGKALFPAKCQRLRQQAAHLVRHLRHLPLSRSGCG